MNDFKNIKEQLYPAGVNLTEVYIDSNECCFFKKGFYYDFTETPHELLLDASGYSKSLAISLNNDLKGVMLDYLVHTLKELRIIIRNDQIYEPAFATPFLFHNVGEKEIEIQVISTKESWTIAPGESKYVEPFYLQYRIGKYETWPGFRKRDFKRFFAHADFYLQDCDVWLSAVNPEIPLHIGNLRHYDMDAFRARLGGGLEASLYLYIDEHKGVFYIHGQHKVWLTDEENALLYESLDEFIKEFRRMNVTFDGYIDYLRNKRG